MQATRHGKDLGQGRGNAADIAQELQLAGAADADSICKEAS
jgi:hypothetical protein